MFINPLLATLILTAVIVFLIVWAVRKFDNRRRLRNLGALNIFSVILELIISLF